MSDVDKRVVQMDFDNKKFEKNVKQSTKSLNTLKASLNFDGVSNSIDQVTVKINRMEYVAAATITNITNRIINLGIRMVKSLSVDNISSGWTKFGQKTTSVATLMAQTLKINGEALTDTSEKLATVNGLMEKLIWFSDETSYTFTDMVDNASKFIAAGLDLDVSVKAMEGIATWAALSGQNASTASRAMYQLSQAMGKGKIQLVDWRSIQTANMDTAQFRENVLETAVAMGQLTKEGEKFVTKTGKKFTQNQFTEQLSSGWFTSEVLTKTLEKYSGAADEIYTIAQKEGKTASEIIELYGDTLDEFGVKAFKAAQEARTLSDALTSVKDAVASKWMTTFELIFGDKDEAIQLWTDLANELYEVFAEAGNFRNEILKVWKSLQGRADLFARGGDDQGAFWNIYDAIIAVKQVIREAWNTIFPITKMEENSDKAQEIGNGIKILTSRFKEFTKTLKLSEVNALRLRKVFEGVFSIFKGLMTLVKAARFIIDPIIDLAKQLVVSILDKIIMLSGKIKINGEALLKVSDKIHASLEKLLDKTVDFSGIFATISKAIKSFINLIKTTSKKITEFIKNAKLLDKIKDVFTAFRKELSKLNPIIEKIKDVFSSFGKKISSAIQTIIDAFKELVNKSGTKKIDAKLVKPMKKAMTGMADTIETVTTVGESSKGKVTLFSSLIELFKSLYDLLIGVLSIGTVVVVLTAKIVKTVAAILQGLGDVLVSLFTGNIKLEGWQKALLIAGAILAGILALVTFIITRIYNIFYTIAAIINPIGIIADSLSGVLDKIGLKMMVSVVDAFARAVLQISISLLIIASINPDRLGPAVGVMLAITVILGALIAATIFIQKQVTKLTSSTSLVAAQITTAKKTVNYMSNTLGGFAQEVKKLLQARAISKVLYAFGTAMLQASVALYIVAQINPDRLLPAVAVFAALFGMISILAFFSKKNNDGIKNAMPGIIQLIVFAAIIKSFAKSLALFKDLNSEQRFNIIAATSTMIAFLAFCIFFLKRIKDFKKYSKDNKKYINLIKSISLVFVSFAISMKILSTIPWNTLGVTLGIIGGFLAEIAGFMALMNLVSKIVKKNNTALKETWKILLSMSLMIFVFAISMKILSTIPWNTLGTTLGIIGAFFVEFVGLIIGLNFASTLVKDSGNLKETTNQMLSISLMLISFAATVVVLSTIPWNTLGATLGVIGGFFVAIAGLMVALNWSNNLYSNVDVGNADKTINQLKVMAVSLLSFAISMKILSTIPWNTLGVTLGIIGGFLAEIAGFMALMNLVSKIGGARIEDIDKLFYGVSAILMSFSLMAKIVSGVDIGTLFAAIGAMGLLFVGLGVLFIELSVAGKIGDSAKVQIATIISVAVALALAVAAIKVLADTDAGQLWSATLALVSVIAAFGVLVAVLTKIEGAIAGANKIVKSFIIFSAGLAVVSVSLAVLASKPWEQILSAALALVSVIAALVGAVALMNVLAISGTDFVKNSAALALGMTALSIAIIILAHALTVLEKIDWPTIGKGAAVLAGGLAILIIAGLAAQKIIVPILGLASAFLMIGLGMLLASMSIQIVTDSILNLSLIAEEQFTLIKDKISEFIPIIGETLGPLLSTFLATIAANIPAIFTIVKEVVHGIIDLLSSEMPGFIDLVVNSIAGLISKLSEKSDEIYSGLSTLISGCLSMIKNNSSAWAQDVVDVIKNVIGVLSDKKNVDDIVKQMFIFVKNLCEAIYNNRSVINEIFDWIVKIINWLLSKLVEKVIDIAGSIAKVLLILLAAAIQILIATLGTLSKLFVILIASVLLILAQTFINLTNVLFEVFKVILKEILKTIVNVMIYFQDVLVSIGYVAAQLVVRGLIKAFQFFTSWLWDLIKWITGGKVDINQKLNDVADEIGNAAKSTVDNLDGSIAQVRAAIKKGASNINETVTMAVEESEVAVLDGLSQISGAVENSSKNISAAFQNVGENAGVGLSNGLLSEEKTVNDSIKKVEESTIDTGEKVYKEHSPSRVFYSIGQNVVKGLANGIVDNSCIATDGMTTMVTQTLTAAKETLDSQNEDDLTIKVGMDISSVEEQSRNISSIMSGINNVNATAYGRNASYNSAAMNKGTSGGSVINTDNSKAVTYNNVFNVTSTDPERSADEIDRALSRQAMMAKLVHGGI